MISRDTMERHNSGEENVSILMDTAGKCLSQQMIPTETDPEGLSMGVKRFLPVPHDVVLRKFLPDSFHIVFKMLTEFGCRES